MVPLKKIVSWPAGLLLGLLLAVPVHADDPALGFADSLAELWRNHPDVQQAEAAMRAAGHDKAGAWAGFLPYAQFDVARSQDGYDERVARLILPLWRGGLNFASLDVAEAGRGAAAADLQRTRLRLGLRLADAYFSVVSAREQDTEWRHYLEVLTQLQGLIGRRAAAGASPQADVQTVVTRLRQADAEAALNESVRASAQSQYVALVGLMATPASWPPQGTALAAPDVEAAVRRDLDEHPEVAYARARAVREEADTRRSRAQLSPEVSLRHTKPFGDEANTSEPVTQIVLQYQTDNGLRAYQTYRAGQQRTLAAEAAVTTTRRDVTAALAVARADYEAARAQLAYQEAAVEAADAVVASSLRQFEAGRKTWIEVLNAQREAHENKLQKVRQRQRLWQANTRLALQGLYWERLLREDGSAPAAAAQTAASMQEPTPEAITAPAQEAASAPTSAPAQADMPQATPAQQTAPIQQTTSSPQTTPLPAAMPRHDETPLPPTALEGTTP